MHFDTAVGVVLGGLVLPFFINPGAIRDTNFIRGVPTKCGFPGQWVRQFCRGFTRAIATTFVARPRRGRSTVEKGVAAGRIGEESRYPC